MTVLEFFQQKYPDSIENGCISLIKIGNLLQMYQILKDKNDYHSLNLVGLCDFGEDVKYIGFNTIEDYKKSIRLKKINSL